MASKWFYEQDGNEHGPVSSGELKQLAASGKLLPEDLVWKEGQANSSSAAKVKGLFTTTAPNRNTSSPPAPPTGKRNESPTSQRQTADGKVASFRKHRLMIGLGAGAILLFIVICIAFVFRGGDASLGSNNGDAKHIKADAPKNEVAAKYVKTSYEPPVIKSPFDSVDYTQGPNGESLTKRQEINQKGMVVLDQYYETANGDKKSHGLMLIRTPEGQNLWEVFMKSGVAHGLSREWDYENGQLTIRGTYIDGKKHGLWEHWYLDGTPSLIEHWNHGFGDGVAITFYESGLKKIQVVWKDGKKNGNFFQWYESGKLQEAGSYLDGAQDNEWIGWHENGSQSSQQNWERGMLVGQERRWSEHGNLVFDQDWSDRSAEYINAYRDTWVTGRRIGEKHSEAESESSRKVQLRAFKDSLHQWVEGRDDLIRRFGAEHPESQRLLGVCDGFQDGFESVQNGR